MKGGPSKSPSPMYGRDRPLGNICISKWLNHYGKFGREVAADVPVLLGKALEPGRPCGLINHLYCDVDWSMFEGVKGKTRRDGSTQPLTAYNNKASIVSDPRWRGGGFQCLILQGGTPVFTWGSLEPRNLYTEVYGWAFAQLMSRLMGKTCPNAAVPMAAWVTGVMSRQLDLDESQSRTCIRANNQGPRI